MRIKSNGTRESYQLAHRAQKVAIWWGLSSIFPSLVALLVGTIILAAICPKRSVEKPSIILVRDREPLLSNLTDIREPLLSNLNDIREPLLSNLSDSRELLLSNLTDIREPLLSNLNDIREPLLSNLSDSREPLLSNLTDIREPLLSNLSEIAPSSATSSLCDMFSGRWVFDNASRPLYKEGRCKYILGQLACEKFGRKDLKYQQWRWQPHGCDLPRFNATALLESLRNKRLMFVGDSLNRNQWVSLVCMVEPWIPEKRRSFLHRRYGGPQVVFNALDYNATIEFYWAPLLVESNCDDPINHPLDDRMVQVRAIEKHARHWSNVDILVFDSYLWWRQGPKIKVSWGSFAGPDRKYEVVKMPRAYKIALKTWSDWIQVHVNRLKTRIFFMGMSATHERAEDWGGIAGHKCFEETEPITKEVHSDSTLNRGMMHMLQMAVDKLQKRGLNIHVINITQLSMYRKDAHPSIYKQQTKNLTKYQLANPATYADCNHWCLPGLPDVWNELLYAYIMHD